MTRSLSRSLCLAAGLLALGLLFASPAAAASLMLGEIDQQTLDALTGAQVGDTLVSTYDYAPETSGGDGAVTSMVFEGSGAAAGQYVYVYEIDHYASSSEIKSGGMMFDFTTVSEVSGIGEAFFVGDDAGVAAPSRAFQTDEGRVGVLFQPFIYAGQTSHQFGLVSPNAPGTVEARVLDSGRVLAQATIYANGAPGVPPMPEPDPRVLLSAGGLVVGLYGLRFRRKA